MLVHSQVGWCFDGDIAINEPNFHTENFLDFKAYEFRKSVQEEWYTVENGWRVAGGSLGIDLAFVDSEIRLQKDLSDTLSVRLQHEHDVYYARKPVRDPLMEIAIRPWHKAIELSFLGTATFDKRQADLGFAATVRTIFTMKKINLIPHIISRSPSLSHCKVLIDTTVGNCGLAQKMIGH